MGEFRLRCTDKKSGSLFWMTNINLEGTILNGLQCLAISIDDCYVRRDVISL